MPTEFLSIAEKKRIKAEILADCDLVADCWVYRKAISPDGYGVKKIAGTPRTVSRYMLAYDTRESIEKPGYDACHKDDICPYKSCCNPEHLYWATKSENCKAREKRAGEERELFASHTFPSGALDKGWDRNAWVDGVYYTDRADPGIDHCLDSLNRGKVVHAITEVWEENFDSEFRKALVFLTTLAQETYQRLVGHA